MPKPGCRKCRQAIAMFNDKDFEGYNGDPLEWAELHLFYHDMRRKRNKPASPAGGNKEG